MRLATDGQKKHGGLPDPLAVCGPRSTTAAEPAATGYFTLIAASFPVPCAMRSTPWLLSASVPPAG